MVQERCHMLNLYFSCITTGNAETHNHEMAQSGVTFALPFVIGINTSDICQEFDTSLVK